MTVADTNKPLKVQTPGRNRIPTRTCLGDWETKPSWRRERRPDPCQQTPHPFTSFPVIVNRGDNLSQSEDTALIDRSRPVKP